MLLICLARSDELPIVENLSVDDRRRSQDTSRGREDWRMVEVGKDLSMMLVNLEL